MKPVPKTFAYIDANNLHRGVKTLGWELDYGRFRVWLSDKYGVEKAYIFIGHLSKNKDLYDKLKKAGFDLVYKDVTFDNTGRVKGNCDSDLITRAMSDSYENIMNKAVLVSSDGDYSPLVKFWKKRGQLETILSPREPNKCSKLLKRMNVPIAYISDQRFLLAAENEKAPGEDELRKGLFPGHGDSLTNTK